MAEATTLLSTDSIPAIISREDFAAFRIKERREPSEKKYRLVKASDPVEKQSDGTLRVVISTARRDRDKDTIAVDGWDLSDYKNNPVILFAHDHRQPVIGKAPVTRLEGDALISYPEFVPEDISSFAGMIEKMVRGGWMKAVSVGFNPSTWVYNEDEGGYDFKTQSLLEYSVVPVGSQPDALFQNAKSAGIDLLPLKQWAEQTLDEWQKHEGLYLKREHIERMHKIADGEKTGFFYGGDKLRYPEHSGWGDAEKFTPQKIPSGEPISLTIEHPVLSEAAIKLEEEQRHRKLTDREKRTGFIDHNAENRWNIGLSKAFDVSRERFPAQSTELALIARYLDCEVKEIAEDFVSVRSPRMGAFLTALEECLAVFATDDVRNFESYRGDSQSKECPPRYDTIKLNSKESRSFLIEGSRFLERLTDSSHVVVKLQPVWYGLAVTYFGKSSDGTAHDFKHKVESRAAEINYLKGEAFSLSGAFLQRGNESWADVFLEPKNEKALKRAVEIINTQGKNMESRGIIMAGPPGTGKTLSARVMMKEAKDATFIWVSARDFYYAGAFGGTAEAFDIARECAPSIILFEDIDNWWGDHSIDLLKTELDGLAKNAGIITMLTTNFPERLPKALIDRPGRFHDVLSIDLPSQKTRELMLAKWLPEMEPAKITAVAKETQGYSGAHIRELARFAKIIEEQEKLELSKAVDEALAKVKEQRELISQTQAPRYRASKELGEMFEKSIATMAERMRARRSDKAMADCPKGESCPWQDGMDSCPAGDDCGMKKNAATEEAASTEEQSSTEIPAAPATEVEQPKAAGSIHKHTITAGNLSKTFEGTVADCPYCRQENSKQVPRDDIDELVAAINVHNRKQKNFPSLSSVSQTVDTNPFETRLRKAAERVITRKTGRVF